MKLLLPTSVGIPGLKETNINYGLKNYKNNLSNINIKAYEFLKDIKFKSQYYVLFDLESTGYEICEIGILCCEIVNNEQIIHTYHKQYTYNYKHVNSFAKRIIHKNYQLTTLKFKDQRNEILELLKGATHILVKGVSFERSIFPELGDKMIDLGLLLRFPKIDYIPRRPLINFFNWLKANNAIDPIETNIRAHNPILECCIFWYIIRDLSPEDIIKLLSPPQAIIQWNRIVNKCIRS